MRGGTVVVRFVDIGEIVDHYRLNFTTFLNCLYSWFCLVDILNLATTTKNI